jgi:signal peptidase II
MHTIFYSWLGYNELLFRLINNVKDSRLNLFMELGTVAGNFLYAPIYGALLLAIGGWHLVDHSRRQEWDDAARWAVTLATFALACVADAAFLHFAKDAFNYPRPPAALGAHTVHLLGTLEDYHHSFPSGHASFAMVLVASLWWPMGSIQRLAGAMFVGWVAVSRVYVGAHFPADVCAGLLSALVIVVAVRWIASKVVVRIIRWWAGSLARRARLL